ncbi:hypothetical protein [Wenzhouxiangella marina]|uniref:Uncharacterized protein n=1 Tax=Wenzhouxiangella marina TaxID=1579979 RepID=A0A0K0XV43_9GAMM|nr:hypothetical protein [Wenzhouxiangella marina]AKS41548.1 hypothetical protein WM2015_1174 [Wenzhouxiangella marina]MBB6086693.1 hypothetical protein [Wenzhouxiangella marina]
MRRYGMEWAWIALMICSLAAGQAISAAPASSIQERGSSTGVPPTVDLIIVVDNSASMTDEIESLQNGLYDHLVGPLLAADVGIQVIMVARHGDLPSESVCIEAPLSSIPSGGCATPPPQPGNTALYRQYSVEVGSHNAWCLLRDTYGGSVPDEFGLAPAGWQAWLQPDAYRVILVVSDDGVICDSYNDADNVVSGGAAATSFDADLLALSPADFGTSVARNYIVHSLIGMGPNSPSTAPWPPSSAVSTLLCPVGVDPGTGHQSLSVLTGGLRFPSCQADDYPVFFRMLAESIFPGAALFRDRFEAE